jgi:type II secretory pathway component PulF
MDTLLQGMPDSIEFLRVVAMVSIIGFVIVGTISGLYLMHIVLSLPLRRAERARFFLDLVETAVKKGQSIEETIVSLSNNHDLSMGVRFHLLAAWIEQGLSLSEALVKVPGFLPLQIMAMLITGQKTVGLLKVLPACRQMLKDAISKTYSALNYLVILTLVITPAGVFIYNVLAVFVLPKLNEITMDMVASRSPGLVFLSDHYMLLMMAQVTMLLAVWLGALLFIGGPRMAAWFPMSENVEYWVPWKRKRLERDFSTILSILLDSGVNESEALTLAADCTSNRIMRRRAAHAVKGLGLGKTLPEAICEMDDAGEFSWRLSNAAHGHGGFGRALAGWHESLAARAFQQEQAAAHGITTAMVFWNGLFVGTIVVSVFMTLISILNGAILW